jgi:hypothetical protein
MISIPSGATTHERLNIEQTMRTFRRQTRQLSPMKKLLFLLSSLLVAATAHATTVIPPTFDELVSKAEFIFQGTVTGVRSEWVGEGGRRHIVSYVTFKVDDAIKGNPGASYTLRMLGGTVDGETMAVADGPKFEVGNRDFVFVEHNGQQFIPLVGIMHGRYRIERDDNGRDIVATNAGAPLSDVARIGKEEHVVASETAALSPAQFKAAIQGSIRSAAIPTKQKP